MAWGLGCRVWGFEGVLEIGHRGVRGFRRLRRFRRLPEGLEGLNGLGFCCVLLVV